MKRRRRLRRLIADEELLRRRAAGEPLRQLADDYAVAHTTLARYFARPGVKEQLKKLGKELRAQQRQLPARRAAERRLERHVRRQADEQAAAEAEQARRYRADLASWRSRGRASGSGLAAWLDERDAPRLPPTRADRHSTYDKEAERTVSAGGGIQALLAATELPTLEAAADSIDPEILIKAFDNDALKRAQPQPLAATLPPRLRRLVPEAEARTVGIEKTQLRHRANARAIPAVRSPADQRARVMHGTPNAQRFIAVISASRTTSRSENSSCQRGSIHDPVIDVVLPPKRDIRGLRTRPKA